MGDSIECAIDGADIAHFRLSHGEPGVDDRRGCERHRDPERPAVEGCAAYPSSSNSQSRDEVLNGPSDEPQLVELRHEFIGYDKETREEQTWKALLKR